MSTISKTEVYKTDANTYMRAVAGMWFGRWWWTLILPVMACFGLSVTVNTAFAFVGLMIIFIIAPMVTMFLYFAHALTPEARIAILPHYVTASETGLDILFPVQDDEIRKFPDVHIIWADITHIELRSRDILIGLTGSHYRFILIPYEVMDNRREFIDICYRNVSSNNEYDTANEDIVPSRNTRT